MIGFLLVSAAFAADVSGEAAKILDRHCSSCHNGKVAMSGLQITSRDALLKGGTRGAALVPGKASESLLMRALAHTEKLAMPPTGKLAETEIATLREWVNQGAAWTASVSAVPSWWSFQPVKRPRPPARGQWGRNEIDDFIWAKLREKNLRPAPEASRAALIRRLTFDLHGLPPTAAEIDAFTRDGSAGAYEALVDRLLASPRYGEKWGKHWLDLVRYGDTAGFEQDPYNLYAWRYRDYVIQSFNEDKPYDRFVKEQIAGDEIYPEDPQAQQGTGYFCVGPNRDMLYKVEDVNRIETLTDFVDTTGAVFLGLTVGCARCHDHKYDPIPQRDYFRMQALFVPAVKSRVFLNYNASRGYDLGENVRTAKLYEFGAQLQDLMGPYREKLRQGKIAKLSEAARQAFAIEEAKRSDEQRALTEAFKGKVNVNDDEVRAAMTAGDSERLHAIERRITSLFSQYAPGPFSPGVVDVGREAEHVYIPGKNDRVEPGFLSALGGGEVPEPPKDAVTTGRRKALAEWLARPEHPLTARVLVNRVWQYHFGRGLVASPSDFGARAGEPSHPELLDWLASEFVAQGWSMKKLHKTMLLSAAYREASAPSAETAERDPENIYLSYFKRRRLEAEEIRDAVLQAAGAINWKMGGRPVVPPLAPEELYGMSQPPGNAWITTANTDEHNRRSVYLISRRTFRVPMLEVFDRPEGVLSCPRRDSSTTATQSLSLLNSGFTLQMAERLARAVGNDDPRAAVNAAWRQALGRQPSDEESTAALAFLDKQRSNLGSMQAALVELSRGLLNLNEFLYVD